MAERTIRTIIVGVDASDQAAAALRWAAEEAETGDRIDAVHAWNLNEIAGLEAPHLNPATFEVGATKLLHEMVDAAIDQDRAAELDIVYSPVHGHPAEELIERSASADLLVVGRRGHGGFKQMLLGSVSRDVVQHAHCPVVVVPGP